MKTLLIGASFLVATAGAAYAVTSYVLPSDFAPDNGRVSIEASYATNFFTPGIALSSDFTLVQPDGTSGIFDQVEINGASTHLGTSLTQRGTYRISSGERLGAVSTLVGVDGTWRPLAQGETPPEGAPTTTIQTVTVADAYVTRSAPTRGAVDAQSSRLALHPITHPNQILVSDGFQVQLLFDGQPFANMPIVLYTDGATDTDTTHYFVTDANGNATIALDHPGRYVIAVRHRANAPAGSPAQVRSYTTSLTFEALTEMPAFTESASEDDDATAAAAERRRRERRRTSGVGGIRH